MDLFTPRFKEKALHPYFVRLIKESKYAPVREVIAEWAKGMEHRKGEMIKFIDEFQLSFNSSLWELYLNKAFKDLGFEIDYSKESPDFCLTSKNGQVINVEAVTTNNAQNRDKAYYERDVVSESSQQEMGEFLDEATIKLLGVIRDKKKLFTGEAPKEHPYSSLEHVKNKPFVIAVAPFDNHLSFTQNNMAINRVLFGINPPRQNHFGEIVQDKVQYVEKKNGTKLDLGIFTNDSYKEISAVIFSTTGMFGKAIVESKIDAMIRATKYRQFSLKQFRANKRKNTLGKSEKRISATHDIISLRYPIGDIVGGSDMHFCHTSEWRESHVDGLHVYYNPFAEVPLDRKLLNTMQITQNSYDTKANHSIQIHHDGCLVSRQVYTNDEQ
ncbi:hypothetical protein [Vibrio parahaemolyticus]|uniref:hypothetical protein n=1 Tax=Vibrio parahaemolyticus TaxID=670 RepID=UPI000401ABED|nr:hypothetical protein [Vibrio parahaemolyticus]HCG7482179.1 hypothetical protein [Vibrio parahaemolyticus]HCH2618933.1 hypothetical protein [Vibrio parahaemolyticus]HCH6235757.1 hypothetical protein [Vibrio parahaemolyticus]HCM1465430.1 hypothetical protein [Vibrio parahaemolyticus]HCM1486636.1 hypothetical protein [Vibrio parahaemolyticus]